MSMKSRAERQAGARLTRSKTRREIGRGSTGHVHVATDDILHRLVAVKRLDPELAKEPQCRSSFMAEARINGRLEHPNIVPVYRLAMDEDGVPFFTAKLVVGHSLANWLGDARRPPASRERLEEGLEIFLRVCDAVAYAHSSGVVHLDIKPDNIMVGGFGQVYLLDWSVARVVGLEQRAEEEPGAVGTPGYLAPEQARGNPAEIGERSDVFGLGGVLYEIVCGRAPYGDHRDPAFLLRQARIGAVVPIRTAAAGLSIAAGLMDIVHRATAPKPADRYGSAFELGREVLAFARGRTEPGSPPSTA
jgi:serine/threonine protein kinase